MKDTKYTDEQLRIYNAVIQLANDCICVEDPRVDRYAFFAELNEKFDIKIKPTAEEISAEHDKEDEAWGELVDHARYWTDSDGCFDYESAEDSRKYFKVIKVLAENDNSEVVPKSSAKSETNMFWLDVAAYPDHIEISPKDLFNK